MRTQNETHDLGPSRQRDLLAHNVGEFIEWEGGADGGAAEEGGTGEIVVPMCNGNIFHEIALVEDIASCDWNFNVENILIGGRRGSGDTHASEEIGEVGGKAGKACASVDIRDFCGHRARRDIRRKSSAVVVPRVDLY